MIAIPRTLSALALFLAVFVGASGLICAAAIDGWLKTVQSVDKNGVGHAEAQDALRKLSAAQSADLPLFLAALDRASPLAANWIRNAFESVAEKTLREKRPLPAAEFERFIGDHSHQPHARRLAYDWLVKIDPTAADRLIPGMLHDPGPEFRRDAVALRLAQAAKIDAAAEKERAVAAYREALSGAVHEDQVKAIVQALDKLGHKIDVVKHLAFITRFVALGPFDNRGGKGFATVYPPEREVRLDATYDGQLGKVSWSPLTTTHEFGIVDIAKQIKPYKGAAMYAVAEFHSPVARSLEIRLGTPNAWKLWVNGEQKFAREEYHRGMDVDQYRVPVAFPAGRSTILLKICQNEQEQDWAQRYQFQLRVCDAGGSGVRSQNESGGGR